MYRDCARESKDNCGLCFSWVFRVLKEMNVLSDLIKLSHEMIGHSLGPNGGLVYCMDSLEKNIVWLQSKLEPLLKDCISKLTKKLNLRLTDVQLVDAHLCSDPGKYLLILNSTQMSKIYLTCSIISIKVLALPNTEGCMVGTWNHNNRKSSTVLWENLILLENKLVIVLSSCTMELSLKERNGILNSSFTTAAMQEKYMKDEENLIMTTDGVKVYIKGWVIAIFVVLYLYGKCSRAVCSSNSDLRIDKCHQLMSVLEYGGLVALFFMIIQFGECQGFINIIPEYRWLKVGLLF
ncbi:hypothetical protein F0562_006271 [Nyssa sinensis]|uniref:Uncharacterized protein n=1 Tax=Nyssa sinensis TaxID=561372 RepID=A0A5J5AP84_9ASTE|nr:hypothetical protein F0562_006271 [Nyssa sinensis]